MLAPAGRRCARCAVASAFKPTASISPGAILPVAHLVSPPARSFSTAPRCASKIGQKPISIPSGVSVEISEPSFTLQRDRGRPKHNALTSTVQFKGPVGESSMQIPPFMSIDRSNPAALTVRVMDAEERRQREMWGTVRAYLQNHIVGVSEGHTAILRLVGVGYRATVEPTAATKEPEYPGQPFVNLKVGYSHPIELGVPQGVNASTPQPTRILLEGVNLERIMQFAAEIRAWRRPEPYKGKGIFVNGETIQLKSKKIK